MREIITTALDLVGFGLLTLAGFLIAVWLGFAIAEGCGALLVLETGVSIRRRRLPVLRPPHCRPV
jgi:hypothetical protein